MKKFFIYIIFLLITTFTYSQAASKINNAQNVPVSVANPSVLVGCDPLPGGLWRVYIKNDIRWETFNINNFNNNVESIGDLKYKPITYVPDWSEITSKPTFFDGDYNSLINQPVIPINTNQLVNGAGFITGINSSNVITALGFTPYNNTNPNGFITNVITSLGYTPVNPNGTSLQYIAGDGTKITFPSIPSAQVNSDWNSVSGVSQILNKPSTFPPSSHTHVISDVTGLQTSLDSKLTIEVDGSITNEIELPSQIGQTGKVLGTNGTTQQWVSTNTGTVTSVGLTSSDITVGGLSPITSTGTYTLTLPNVNSNVGTFNNITINAKGQTTAGSNVPYITGNQNITLSGDVTGSGTTGITTTLASTGTSGTYGIVTTDSKGRVTSGKRQVAYSGTTNASGVYSVSFGVTYSVPPNLQANIIGGTNNQVITMTVTTTGFTATVVQRNSVNLLGIDVLLSATSNVNGATVDALITEK